MLGIVLTPDQIEAAPPEVRTWIEDLVGRSFPARRPTSATHVPPVRDVALAAIDHDEARRIFDRIKGDYLACHLFMEIGRDDPTPAPVPAGLHVMRLADLARQLRVGDGNRLLACFGAITTALRAVRDDPAENLFAVDGHGQCFVSEATHRTVHGLWREILAAQLERFASARTTPAMPCIASPSVSVTPPYRAHLETTEAAHQGGPAERRP